MKNNNTAQQITIQEALLENRMTQWEHLKDKPEKTMRDVQQEGNLLTEITRINDKIDRLKREQANENTPQVEAAVDYEAWCRDLIRDADIRYTAKPNAYWLRREHAGEAKNIPIPPLAFRERFSRLQDREVREHFDRLMEEQKRKFDEVIYSFTPQGPSVLNLMDIRNWVEPVEGEVNDLFDILLWSVGGGTEEGYEHLRQCLLWKYMYPADFMLPSPVLYGEGGVGKNFMIDGVLRTLFGGQSTSLGISQVLGGFNGLMAGKSVVMVNEAAGDRVDYEKVKEIVHSPTLTINEKYGGQYQADATAWVWLCCNDPAGAVRMAGNGVDRRWSPIELKHTLLHWVQELKGLSEQEAKNWLLDNGGVARNRDEVGKWFSSLIAKGLPERRPEPLHTAGYADLTDSQKGPLEDLVDLIDGHADVQYLMGDLVYEAYRQLQKRTNPSGRPLGRNKFYKTLEVYLEKQWSGRWKLDRTDVYSGQGPTATKTKQKVMFRVGVEERMYSDMSKYVDCVQNVLLVQSSFAPKFGSVD